MSATSFDLLHRNVQRRLWDMAWTELRPVQDDAIRHILLKRTDAVISSPTASGKTEAAFLPVLSSIADTPTGSVRAMYIGPLKALINDQFRRVEELCTRLEMPVCKWHGDVGDSAKKQLLRTPAGVLLITPESLEAMLVRRPSEIPKLFGKLGFVVVDEMHAFMGTERGAQLVSQLSRLCRRAGCDPIRIGLSATLGEPGLALRWLRPRGPAATLITDTGGSSPLQMRVRGLWQPPRLDGREVEDDEPVMRELARAVLLASSGKTNLVFANAKSRIEKLADALKTQAAELKLSDEIVVHHGSLSKETRHHAEERLREARACTAVCTNTLELGIDIGSIDQVVQVTAPWSVASLLQRIGRSGRRDGASRILRGFFIGQKPDERSDVWERLHLDLVQGIATIELMLEGFIEPPAVGRPHLSTLVHQTLAFLAETGGTQANVLLKILRESGAFGDVPGSDFGEVLRGLHQHDLVEQMGDGTLILGLAGQRIVEHYSFFAAFNAPEELRVVHGADEIGTIAMPPAPGEHLILAGRRWRVEFVDIERREVVVVPARGRKEPRFTPSRGQVHPAVHAKMKQALLGTALPKYLDSVALEILAVARTEAERQNRFVPAARATPDGGRLFVFGGSKVQETLFLVLAAAGVRVTDFDVGFDVEGDIGRTIQALRAFVGKPDVLPLAEYADRVLKRREFGREKFERYVAPDVWQRAYARDELDGAGARAAAFALVDALTLDPTASGAGGSDDEAPSSTATPDAAEERKEPAPIVRGCLNDVSDLVAEIAAVAEEAVDAFRIVIVPSEAHAHAARRELARAGRADLLTGTRFTSITSLATDCLVEAGCDFRAGEEALRPLRLRRVFANPPPLRYFDASLLTGKLGWVEAFARTIGELEAAGLTPQMLAGATTDPRARDLADIWEAIEAAAGPSWTRPRIVREATRLILSDPGVIGGEPVVLAPLSGHEPKVDIDFVRALPNANLAVWAARPKRASHASRIHDFVSAEASTLWQEASLSSPETTQLELLRARLFEDPASGVPPKRLEPDASLHLEQYESVEAEVEAAALWLQREVTLHQVALEQIALLVPTLDAFAVQLFEHCTDLGLPVHVRGGLPPTVSPMFSRLSLVLVAVADGLDRDGLIALLPSLRIAREGRDSAAVTEAIDVVDAVGSQERDVRRWLDRLRARVVRPVLEAPSSRGDARADEKLRTLLSLLEPPLGALAGAADAFASGATLTELCERTIEFVHDHLVASGTDRLVDAFVDRMTTVCADPELASLSGREAHRLLADTLSTTRLTEGRFGDARVTIVTIEEAAGIPFDSVRVVCMAEGLFPSTPREDPILGESLRAELRAVGIRPVADKSTRQLHAFDRVVRNTKHRLVVSSLRRDSRGTHRALSPVITEVATALGRPEFNSPREETQRKAFEPFHLVMDEFAFNAPLRSTSWHARASRAREVPPKAAAGALDLTRTLSLLDSKRAADSLDGMFPEAGWFPALPGLSSVRPLSASRWRTFLECPHRFLFETILGLEPRKEAAEDGELDPATYGSLFHRAVEGFYREHASDLIGRDVPLEALEQRARSIADQALSELLLVHPVAGESVSTAQRRRLHRDVAALLRIDRDFGLSRIVAVEQGFGVDEPLAIPLGEVEVFVRGYIDRIDVEAGVTVIRDLKTGRAKPRRPGDFDPAIDAQLALYALVARARPKEWGLSEPMSAAYVYPRAAGVPMRAFQREEFEELVARGRRWMEMTVALGQARSFPRTPNSADCTHCSFQAACGPSADRRATEVLGSSPSPLSMFRELKEQ